MPNLPRFYCAQLYKLFAKTVIILNLELASSHPLVPFWGKSGVLRNSTNSIPENAAIF